MERNRAPWWLLPNLLSLDAPLVALAWAWMFSKAWGVVSLPWQLWGTLAAAVWIIYVLDRLIDARVHQGKTGLERRHEFHHRYRKILFVGVILAISWCLYTVLFTLSRTVAMYGAFVSGFSILYFIMAFTRTGENHTGISKNAVAGLTFAYGTAAGIHAYSPVMVFQQMLFSWEVLLFAGLCAINMTAIDFWELEGEDEEDAAALLSTATLLVGGVAMFFSFRGDEFNTPFFYAILVGAAALHVLNRTRTRWKKEQRRLWVDLAILLPVLMYWVWVRFDGLSQT